MRNFGNTSRCRVLVVGVGSIGERHVRCFLQTGRASLTICDVNQGLRDDVGRRYGVERQFSALDEALAEPHDVAVIAVPAHLHVPVAQQAVDAGVDVLIEKPLSVTMDGVAELCEAVARQRRLAAVGYVYRAHPALAAMKQAIESGSFGAPLQLVAVAGQHFPTYRPAYRDSYYVNHANGGGAIQDAMTHLVNTGEWIIGAMDRVVADADHKRLEGAVVEDAVHFLARHGPVMASYSLNQFQAPNEITVTVVCEQGTARFEYHLHRWRFMLEPETPWQDEPAIGIERDTLFARQAASFLDAAERRAASLCSLDEGVQTLRVNLAAMKSLESGAWQEIAR